MQAFVASRSGLSDFPLYDYKISAGFPSPADDHMDIGLNLNEYLIPNPESTFFVRAKSDSMIGAGITEGSLLVVDKSVQPKHNKLVIAVLDGEFIVRRLKVTKNGYLLVAENPKYLPVKLNEDSYIWGVITFIIHQPR